MATQTRTYHAMSVLNSRTIWLNVAAAIVGILALPEVSTLIPPNYLPMIAMVTAALNMILRTRTVRPVAFIAPGDTKAVTVAKLDPPVKTITD